MARARGALALAALLLAAAGCGSGSGAPGTATTAPTAAPASTLAAAPPQPSEGCGDPPATARAFWLDAPGGARLQAAAVGDGPDAAVFVHESGGPGLCGFWPYAEWLARTRHVRAVLFDQCGYGDSSCPGGGEDGRAWAQATAAAVAWARDHGARRVTLVGASFGGIVVLHAAASIRPRVDAVVDLSGELSWNDLDSLPAARRLAVPALFAVAPGDRYVSVADMRRLYQASSARPKRLVVLSEELGHGWAMLENGGWTPLASTVADWVAGRPS